MSHSLSSGFGGQNRRVCEWPYPGARSELGVRVRRAEPRRAQPHHGLYPHEHCEQPISRCVHDHANPGN